MPMNAEHLWERVKSAWAMLGGPPARRAAPRPRAPFPRPPADAPPMEKDGFVDEAVPWLDAVYRFSLRLTGGDADAADDLAQETFLRAYRAWHTFERGTNARSWLFTICRNAYLKGRERMSARREVPAADFDARVEILAATSAFETLAPDPEGDFFDGTLDDAVVRAVDALPEDFREVLVLSDLGDLAYGEIAQVLDIPVGTVKSRLFRARRQLQERLLEFAVETGYVEPDGPAAREDA